MKLKYELSMVEIGGEKMAVPIDSGEGFRGVLQMNGTTEAILRLLEQDTDEEAIIAALAEEYDDEERIRTGVHKVLEMLRTEGLLDEGL